MYPCTVHFYLLAINSLASVHCNVDSCYQTCLLKIVCFSPGYKTVQLHSSSPAPRPAVADAAGWLTS